MLANHQLKAYKTIGPGVRLQYVCFTCRLKLMAISYSYMYVRMYLCTNICTHMYASMHTCVCSVCMHAYIYLCMYFTYLNMSSSHHSIDNQYYIHKQNFQ